MTHRRGPLLTLTGMVGLALVLLNVNVGDERSAVAAPAGAEAAASAPAPAALLPAAAVPVNPPVAAATRPETPPPAVSTEAVYAGRTSGNEATIAIAVKPGRAVAYYCDGKKIEAWLEGPVEGSTAALTGAGGTSLTGAVTGNAVLGTVTVGGTSLPFAAAIAAPPAGPYRGDVAIDGVRKRIGWNVLPDGSVTGLASDARGTAPAPALDPATGTANLDGTTVVARPITGADRIG